MLAKSETSRKHSVPSRPSRCAVGLTGEDCGSDSTPFLPDPGKGAQLPSFTCSPAGPPREVLSKRRTTEPGAWVHFSLRTKGYLAITGTFSSSLFFFSFLSSLNHFSFPDQSRSWPLDVLRGCRSWAGRGAYCPRQARGGAGETRAEVLRSASPRPAPLAVCPWPCLPGPHKCAWCPREEARL